MKLKGDISANPTEIGEQPTITLWHRASYDILSRHSILVSNSLLIISADNVMINARHDGWQPSRESS